MQDPPTRDRIKQEAMRLFVARGIDAVSLRDIADAVGIKAPSLYAHFRSRDALVAEMFAQGYAAYGARLAAAAATPGRFQDRLAAMVRTICRLHAEDSVLFGFLLLTQHGNLRDVPVSSEDNPVDVLCRTVAAGMLDGDIPARDPVLIAAALMGVILQPATFHLYGRMTATLAEQADAIVDLALRVAS